jgi:hypothetical protein
MKNGQSTGKALKREHAALQNMKFLIFCYFCGPIVPSWIRIRIQPTEINANP